MTKKDFERQGMEDDSFVKYMGDRIEDLTEEEMSKLPWDLGFDQEEVDVEAGKARAGGTGSPKLGEDNPPFKKSRKSASDSGA